MDLIEKFEKRRRELGMSRVALSKRSKVSLPTVNRILTRQHLGASFANILAIAESLGLDLKIEAHSRSDELRRKQAMNKARHIVRLVQGTSALEGQGLDQLELEEMVQRTFNELILTKRKFWEA